MERLKLFAATIGGLLLIFMMEVPLVMYAGWLFKQINRTSTATDYREISRPSAERFIKMEKGKVFVVDDSESDISAVFNGENITLTLTDLNLDGDKAVIIITDNKPWGIGKEDRVVTQIYYKNKHDAEGIEESEARVHAQDINEVYDLALKLLVETNRDDLRKESQ